MVMENEAVHPMKGWDDLKRRLGTGYRVYAFCHPSMPSMPLIVVHIAMANKIPSALEEVLSTDSRFSWTKTFHIGVCWECHMYCTQLSTWLSKWLNTYIMLLIEWNNMLTETAIRQWLFCPYASSFLLARWHIIWSACYHAESGVCHNSRGINATLKSV